MFRRFSANFAVFSVFLDFILVALGLFAAALLRVPLNVLPFVEKLQEPVIILPWMLYLAFPLIWVAVLMLFSVYDGRKHLRIADEFSSLTLGSVLALVAMAGVLYLSYRLISRFLFLFFFILTYLLLLSWRAAFRLAFRWKLLPAPQSRRVLILGVGSVGWRLGEQILQQRKLGLALVGYLDDEITPGEAAGLVLGGLNQVRDVIQHSSVTDVVVALPLSEYARMIQVVSELHDLAVQVWVIPDYFSLTLHRASVEDFAGIPMLDLRAPALSEYQRMVKRGFDVAVAVLAMPFVLIAMGVVAILIKLDDGGPVFYRARRVGENGRLFDMLKFRTMLVNADQLIHQVEKKDKSGNVIHKTKDDPRITRVGRFLRRTSLDELPQLVNVLKGDMSLVGPRPEMPQLVEKYELWQRKRFAVPQGMTGWWQINGRSDKPMHLHTDEDLYYVQHYSIWLDLQIVVRTVWVVLHGKGAY